MKLLLIEDHTRLAERVSHHLSKQFVVDITNRGKDGIVKALQHPYDAIILDLNLPDTHGLEVCRALRAKGITAPILVLTGIDETKSRVNLLDSGADDYVLKPFNPDELSARMRALVRRRDNGYNNHIIRYKDLMIDSNSRRVERAGREIKLRRKEFDILEYLVANRGRAITRNMILDHAWNGARDGWYNTVDVHIKYLRDKIDRPFKTPLIKTAYGIGYMVDDTA